MLPLLRESDSHAEQPNLHCCGHESPDRQNNHSRAARPVGGLANKGPLLRTVLEKQPQTLLHLPGLSHRTGPLHAHGLDEGVDQRAGAVPTRWDIYFGHF